LSAQKTVLFAISRHGVLKLVGKILYSGLNTVKISFRFGFVWSRNLILNFLGVVYYEVTYLFL